jgi:hypothetical protein
MKCQKIEVPLDTTAREREGYGHGGATCGIEPPPPLPERLGANNELGAKEGNEGLCAGRARRRQSERIRNAVPLCTAHGIGRCSGGGECVGGETRRDDKKKVMEVWSDMEATTAPRRHATCTNRDARG